VNSSLARDDHTHLLDGDFKVQDPIFNKPEDENVDAL
jgi:hypothetical protein